jgi:FixJ family two-component response regulator
VDETPITVLVVDDDESVRKAMRRLLVSNGYQVITYQSAEELLLSSFVRGKVCLLLDICLPGLSGLDLHARLAASGVKCPVIFMTAHDEPEWLKKAEEAGAVAFLRKPFDEQSLFNALSLSCSER